MKISTYKWFLIILLLIPSSVFADSLVFTPNTSVYGDLEDPNVNASLSGTHAYRCFRSDGVPLGGNGCAIGTVNDAWSSASVFGGCSGINTSVDTSNGIAGTIACLYADYTQSDWAAECSNGTTGSYAGCLASNAYAGQQVDYVITSPGGGGGGDFATSTIDQTQQNYFNLYWSFLATVFFVVWLISPRK